MIYLDYSDFVNVTNDDNDIVGITELKQYCERNNLVYKDMRDWMITVAKYKVVGLNKFYKYNKIHEKSFIGIKLVDK